MTQRILVDRSLCDGNGICAQEAPSHFALDASDALIVLLDLVEEADVPAIRRAVGGCPKAALRLVDDQAP